MLDIKIIRETPDMVKEDLKRRPNFDTSIVDKILEVDNKWREVKSSLDKLKGEKNKESKNISKIKKEGGDIKSQLEKVKEISTDIENQDKELKKLEKERNSILINIPNILDKEVPFGEDDEENKEIELVLEKPVFNFKIRDHRELCELNDWYDIDTASKHSGARFYYLKNELVLLQLALYSFVMEKMVLKGYTPVETPPMLRRESIGKSVSLEDFEDAIYDIKDEDLCLIGTSEHSLALLHADAMLNYKDLPKKYIGISPCFRREAGVTKDEKGIFRVHNFNKIEQFIFSTEEQSNDLHKEITENAKEIFRELGVHFRVVDICSGDIGAFATRKYDIEAWLPGQDKYREMVSASNYRNYGARRLNCRYQDEKNNVKFANTLNSTAVALVRCLIAIIEQHQTEDGNVKIPEVLRKYFNGRELLKE